MLILVFILLEMFEKNLPDPCLFGSDPFQGTYQHQKKSLKFFKRKSMLLYLILLALHRSGFRALDPVQIQNQEPKHWIAKLPFSAQRRK